MICIGRGQDLLIIGTSRRGRVDFLKEREKKAKEKELMVKKLSHEYTYLICEVSYVNY